MFTKEVIDMIILGIGQTLYMVVLSTLFGYVLGLPWGIALAVTNKEGIRPNAPFYRVMDFITNIMRSTPFLVTDRPRRSFPWSSPPRPLSRVWWNPRSWKWIPA